MKKIVQKYLSLFQNLTHPRKVTRRKSKGQSLVEVAIAFPLLIMLFSGMVEFGFMLNTYLSLLDATRQTARYYANFNPFTTTTDNSTIPPTITVVDDPTFYDQVAGTMIDTLAPPGAGTEYTRKIVLDPTRDDIIISVLKVSVSDSTHAITDIERFPVGLPNPYVQVFGNQLSAYDDDAHDNARIIELMTENGAVPVRSGILIIEIYYGYDGVLKLPWVSGFLNTITLHADTVMPLVAAKPPRTP